MGRRRGSERERDAIRSIGLDDTELEPQLVQLAIRKQRWYLWPWPTRFLVQLPKLIQNLLNPLL